ncbi:MAG: DUF4912 domain-containing protein [Planctomycetes bacterium]|nr:DUF4912 domain-containing protein [Planctomycetota bacterium]
MLNNFYPIPEKPAVKPAQLKAREQKDPYIDRGPDLQYSYNRDVLYALVRDPNCIFVFWELPSADQSRNWALKIINVTKREIAIRPVNFSVRNWYFAGIPADCAYCVELGLWERNEFSPVMQSNMVKTPRSVPSMEVDIDWPFTPEELEVYNNLVRRITSAPLTCSSPVK